MNVNLRLLAFDNRFFAFRTTNKNLFLLSILLSLTGGGYKTLAQIGGPNGTGKWGEVISLPIVPAAAANLPDGKILTWSARDRFSFGGNQGKTYTVVFDPETNTNEELLISNTQHDMFCPGTSSIVDGRVIVTGGSSSNKTSIYDPFTQQWTASGTMNIPRGYHAMVTLANGKVFTIGGSWSGGRGNKHAEVWQNETWSRLSGVPVTSITDGTPGGDKDYHIWLWPAPNGKVFHAGPSPKMHWIETNGNGSYSQAGNRGDDVYAVNGITVMYDVGKILKAGGSKSYGGSTLSNGNSYTIDINQDQVKVKKVQSLTYPRSKHNSVVLPNGEVLVIGGLRGSENFSDLNSRYTPELWNPQTEKWRSVANMTVPRNYHSIALLLPDGRVLAGGGGLCGGCTANHPDIEIFSPSYLFNTDGSDATRPQIHYAPLQAKQGTKHIIKTNSAIDYFAMVRYNSVTHSTNNEQRRFQVPAIDLGDNTYEITVPNVHIAIPGYYMFFAMNMQGTPSLASVMQVDPNHNSAPKLFAKVKLEGAMDNNSTLMRADLKNSGQLGMNDPFGLGETMAANLQARNGKNAPVDWIRVQVRDKNDPATIVAERAVLVQRDGDLMDAQGNSPISFPGIASGTYYVSISHTNHLGVMTAQTLNINGSRYVNFSDPNTQTFSTGAAPQKNKDGSMFLWAGDANGDGIINAVDKNLFWRQENGQGYEYGTTKADFNLDGSVNAADLNVIWRNNNSRIGQVPN